MITRVTIIALVSLCSACDLGPTREEVLDPDADGVLWPDDCASDAPAVHPGADEIPYDGVDNDCDPSTPDDDLDEDGFGVEVDCDDADAEVSPSAEEVTYDDLDNDCDPDTPDDDLDGDGFGEADDCDDADATVAPGAAEVCGDGVLNDCEGSAAEAWEACSDASGALAEVANRSTGSDGVDYNYGFAVAGHSDPANHLAQLAIGAVRNITAGSVGGAAYLFRNVPPSAVMGSQTTADARIGLTSAEAGDCLGTAITFAGDLVGDGYVYTAVGADCTMDQHGSVYVLLPRESTKPETIGDENSVELIGSVVDGQLGFSVAGAGDLNGDGYDDLLAGAPYLDAGDHQAGAVYIVWGESTLLDAATAGIEEVSTRIDGQTETWFGTSLAGVGDVDGDGLRDILAAARLGPDNDATVLTEEAAFLFLAPGEEAPASSGDAGAIYHGCGAQVDGAARCAYAAVGAGDVDEDGYDDLLVGAFNEGGMYAQGAAAFLLPGGHSPSSGELADAPSVFDLPGCSTCSGSASSVKHAYDVTKTSMAGNGDMNGDGHVDLLIGDPASSENVDAEALAGAVYLILGPVPVDGLGTEELGSSGRPTWYGGQKCAAAGWSVAMADLDFDGADEAIIGVPTCDIAGDMDGDGVAEGASTGFVAILPGSAL